MKPTAYYLSLNEDQEYLFLTDGTNRYLEYHDAGYVEPLASTTLPMDSTNPLLQQLSLEAESAGKRVNTEQFLKIIGEWSTIVSDHISSHSAKPELKSSRYIKSVRLILDNDAYVDITTVETQPYHIRIFDGGTYGIASTIKNCKAYARDILKFNIPTSAFKLLKE